MKVCFFVGKGGTGKTTVSLAYGLGLSKAGFKTLVVSLDPAHNLGDALDLKIGNRLRKLEHNLYAIEIDVEKIIKKYLTDLSQRMKGLFKYLSVIGLEKYFDVLQFSPGMEEYSILEVLKEFISSKDFDLILFDMPPTGIALRVLGIPEISVLWAERLIELRKKIISRRKMIENVEEKNLKISEEDPVMNELLNYKEEMKRLKSFFSSEKCFVNLVTTPEKVALFESERILDCLKKLNIRIGNIFINKIIKLENIPFELEGKIKEQELVIAELKSRFSEIVELPLEKEILTGILKLREFYNNYLHRKDIDVL